MEVIPAIDLLGGRVVRLPGGDYRWPIVYSEDPLAVARRWAGEGAGRLHVVDLDGARLGRPVQGPLVARLAGEAGLPCQGAGGLRDADAVTSALASGADRVVLGTTLLDTPSLAAQLVATHGERICAALDVRAGRAVGSGWLPGGAALGLEAASERVREYGFSTVVLTGVERDGALRGPDLALTARVRQALPGIRLIGSGGITTLDDLRRLAELGLDGAILGRALYEDRIRLPEAIAAVA